MSQRRAVLRVDFGGTPCAALFLCGVPLLLK
jgi:hypothetical protein